MKIRFTGWLVFAVTALAVAILCLLRLFAVGLCVGIAGVMLALIVALFRHGKQNLRETADAAAKEAEKTETDAPDRE